MDGISMLLSRSKVFGYSRRVLQYIIPDIFYFERFRHDKCSVTIFSYPQLLDEMQLDKPFLAYSSSVASVFLSILRHHSWTNPRVQELASVVWE